MFRSFVCIALIGLFVTMASGADKLPKTHSEKAIAKAIKVLEAERETANDPLDQAKIDKVIRDLEASIASPEPEVKPFGTKFEVKPATLKKKFGGKSSYNAKTGELTLAYDFTNKNQLGDFNAAEIKKALVANGWLMVDASDKLHHSAKWKSFNVSAVMNLKSLKGGGIASSNGTSLLTGGGYAEAIGLNVPDGSDTGKEVGGNLRNGRIPVSLWVNPEKSGLTFGDERLVTETARKEDTHEIVLIGGKEGCGFSNLIIVGIPEPLWFRQILDAP